jgi:hypothetical protein
MRRPAPSLIAALFLLLTAACGSGTPTTPPPPPPPTTGSLAVQVSGLPPTTPAAIQVSGPGGYSQVVNGSITLTNLTPGDYLVSRAAIVSTPYSYTPSVAAATVAVTAGGSATAAVAFAATTGALQLTLGGLPANLTGSVTVTGAGGFTQVVQATTRLDNLAPGSYQVLGAATSDVGLGYDAGAAETVVVTSGATAARVVTWNLTIEARTTAERADVDAGPKVKLIYAVPSDATDRQFDTNGAMHRSVSSWQRWLAAQTGGRALRLDVTETGALDVAFLRLPRTEAAYANLGIAMRDALEADLAALGFNDGNKAYLVVFDGVNITACGSAPRPPLLPGRVAGLYLRGTIPGADPCATHSLAASATAAPGYLEFVSLHEVLHILGVVGAGAPNHAFDGHVGHDPSDLMYAGVQPWTPSRLDQSRSNYFNPAGLGVGLPNLATTGYLLP